MRGTQWDSFTAVHAPRPFDIPWPELVAWLTTPKRHGLGWSAAIFEGSRADANVVAVTAGAFDIDKGDHDAAKVLSAFPGIAAVLHSTRKHKTFSKEKKNLGEYLGQRWRIVLQTDREIQPGADFDAWWSGIRHWLEKAGIAVDGSASDESRFWFAPSQPGEGCPPFESYVQDGRPIVVDKVKALARKEEPPAHKNEPRVKTSGPAVERARQELAALMPAVQGDEGSKQMMKAACICVCRYRLSDDETWDVLGGYNDRCEPPFTDKELRHKIASARARGKMPPAPMVETERLPIQDGPRLDAVLQLAEQALGTHPEIYSRGEDLVHVCFEEGRPVIRRVTEAYLYAVLCTVARFYIVKESKLGEIEEKDIVPPKRVVQAIYGMPAWPSIRSLSAVIQAPTLRPDGSVIQVPGYDLETGVLYIPNATYPTIEGTPTQKQAALALAELREIFCDFPYAKGARDVPVAALLSMVGRSAIEGAVPVIVFDANIRGSGKTLQADAITLVATGGKAPKKTFPESEEEAAKVLDSYALRGGPALLFDNVTRPFGGGSLDAYATSDSIECRKLGNSDILTRPWLTIMMATGNNMSFIADTSRRVLVCTLESKLENPESKQDQRHRPLDEWILSNRPRLVAAALCVLRAWWAAGKPGKPDLWGSYDSWSSTIPLALSFAGGEDVMQCRPAAMGMGDSDTDRLSVVLEHWGGTAISIRTMISTLYPSGPERNAPSPFDSLKDVLEALTRRPQDGKPNAREVGEHFRKWKKRVLLGKTLVTETGAGGVAKWRVANAET